MGFDSLSALKVRNRLNAVTELQLPPGVLFDHATPGALVEHLKKELLDY